MFNFFKNNNLKESENIKLNPLPYLMLELARIDGHIDDKEIDLIREALNEIGYSKTDEMFNKYMKSVEEETSLHDWVEEINKNYSEIEKISLLKKLWRLVIADSVKEPYEEALFNKIGELLKIKRSIIQKIKFKVSANI